MVHSICRLHAVVLHSVCLCFLKDTAGASRECYSDSLSACIIISGLFSILPVRWYDGHGLMEYFNCSIVKSRKQRIRKCVGPRGPGWPFFIYFFAFIFLDLDLNVI